MRKYIFTIIMIMLVIFSFSGSVFATSPRAITTISVYSLDYPYVGEKVDRDVTLHFMAYSTVNKVVWYKDNVKVEGDTFPTEGKYICRVYITPNDGYYIPYNVAITANVKRDDKDTALGDDKDGFFCELTYYVEKKPSGFPEKIRFLDMIKPAYNQKLSYEMTSEFPQYYNYTKMEWYKDGELLPEGFRAINGEYICRVYIELYNGFELRSGLFAAIGGELSKEIIRDQKGTYFEVKYFVGPVKDEKEISRIDLEFEPKPYFGQSVNNISIKPLYKSNYYKIGDVEWYYNDFRMLDPYFYEGKRCSIT